MSDSLYIPKMAAVTASLLTTGVGLGITYTTNVFVQAPAVPASAAIHITHSVFSNLGKVMVPSIIVATGLYAYIAYKQPGRFIDSPYARAGLTHALGMPFTALFIVPRAIKPLMNALALGGGAASVARLGGEDAAKAICRTFGNLNLIRATIFGLGAIQGLSAAVSGR